MKVTDDQYAFSEDSALLGDCIRELQGRAFLEIGMGNGVNLQRYAHNFELAVGTDLQSLAVMKRIRSDAFELVVTDRAICFRQEAFDVVVFNPPYMPSDTLEDIAVDGGRMGVEVPLSFLREALRVSKPNSIILMLLSTHSDLHAFQEYCSENSLTYKIVAEKKLFFETLLVYDIRSDQESKPRFQTNHGE